jgi:electron transfer flavoprotein beta subunit
MKIAVCVKVVPRSAVPMRLDPATGRLDRTGASEINPPDLFAIEEALQLRERLGEGEVVVVSVGPETGLESLRVALAMGADRLVAVSDEAIAGSDLIGTARVLAAALEPEAPDVVIAGSLSRDGSGGTIWGALAELLDRPVVSGVHTIEVADGRLRGTRQIVGGEQVVEASLPVVVSLAGSANSPRYPSFRDIVAAKKVELRGVGLAEIGLEPSAVGAGAARTTVLGVAPAPARRTAGEVVEDGGTGAAWLADLLIAKGLA